MNNKAPKNIVIVPDSFKGSLSAIDVCLIISEALKAKIQDLNIKCIPVADGGEGSVDAFLASLLGKRINVNVRGPYGEQIESFYGLMNNGCAVVEMAAAAGLPLVGENRNAKKTTTFGVGELILDAVKRGARKIIIGLGGSATNDGGCGMASACGVHFYNSEGSEFVPVGETLCEIARIDASEIFSVLDGVEVITMCDINNPLCGEIGAAAMFAPQKGANPSDVKLLDAGLNHMASIIKRDIGMDVKNIPGAGAAGGAGAGMVAYFNSRLQMGIDTVLDICDFDNALKEADLVISGEGSFDEQSLHGKVIDGIAKRCKSKNVPLAIFAGKIDKDSIKPALEAGVSFLCCINPENISIQKAISHASGNLLASVFAFADKLIDGDLTEPFIQM